MGRQKQFDEQIRLPLPAGMTARIDAVLAPGEPRLDMIRDALEREIKRRTRKAMREAMPSPSASHSV